MMSSNFKRSENYKSCICCKFHVEPRNLPRSPILGQDDLVLSGQTWISNKKILKNPDLFSDKSQKCFYMKPDSNNPVPKPAISRFQGAKCGRLAFAGFTTNMAIRVVEFSSSGYKIGKIFA